LRIGNKLGFTHIEFVYRRIASYRTMDVLKLVV